MVVERKNKIEQEFKPQCSKWQWLDQGGVSWSSKFVQIYVSYTMGSPLCSEVWRMSVVLDLKLNLKAVNVVQCHLSQSRRELVWILLQVCCTRWMRVNIKILLRVYLAADNNSISRAKLQQIETYKKLHGVYKHSKTCHRLRHHLHWREYFLVAELRR